MYKNIKTLEMKCNKIIKIIKYKSKKRCVVPSLSTACVRTWSSMVIPMR